MAGIYHGSLYRPERRWRHSGRAGAVSGGPNLAAGEHDSFFQPTVSDAVVTLFEHCACALDQSLVSGGHGLPLIGTGDWNDGMNRVGERGEGESVWLGWLLYATLNSFIPLADARGEVRRSAAWRAHAIALQASLEREAWTGDGIVGVGSTTVRHWGRQSAMNARSTPLPNPGRCSRALLI